jgi:hypothetical protein
LPSFSVSHRGQSRVGYPNLDQAGTRALVPLARISSADACGRGVRGGSAIAIRRNCLARVVRIKAVSAATAVAEAREAAQALAFLAFKILREIMRTGSSDTARLAAAKEVVDRAHGKTKAAEAAPRKTRD